MIVPNLADRAAYTIDEFCMAHRISRRTFYDLIDRGEAPQLMHIGSKKLISAEAAAEWRRQRERTEAGTGSEGGA